MGRALFLEEDDPAGKPIRVCGFKVRVEYPAGSLKVKRDEETGKVRWKRRMHHDYGYLVGVMGADGDSLDCFICPPDERDEDAPIHVVHQLKAHDGSFDEDKAFIGYPSKRAAVDAYKAHCHDFENLYGGVTTFPADGFADKYGADFHDQEELPDDGTFMATMGDGDVGVGGDGSVIQVSGKPQEADRDGIMAFAQWMVSTGWDVYPRPQELQADPSYEAIGPGISMVGKRKDLERTVSQLPESIRNRTEIRLVENLAIDEVADLISKKISVDEYVAKDGGDNVVVAFFVLGASTAVEPLRAFCEGNPYVILADSGDSDTEKNTSIVYCELDRATIEPKKIDSLVGDVCRVAGLKPSELEVAFPGSGDRLFPYSLRTMEAFCSGTRLARSKKDEKPSRPVSEFWVSPAGRTATGITEALGEELKESGWFRVEVGDLTDASVLILEGASMEGALLAAKRAAAGLKLPLTGIVVELGKGPGGRTSVFGSIMALETVVTSRRCNLTTSSR